MSLLRLFTNEELEDEEGEAPDRGEEGHDPPRPHPAGVHDLFERGARRDDRWHSSDHRLRDGEALDHLRHKARLASGGANPFGGCDDFHLYFNAVLRSV